MPELPDGWRAVSVLRPAGGSSFGGDFLVSACDGKVLELALVDVAGKGIDAGTRALMDVIAAEPRVDATAIQTVGEKSYDGFALAIVRS